MPDREAPPPADRDALDAVRAHLDDAHAAAERLVREAQRQAEERRGGAGRAAARLESSRRGRHRRGGVPDLQALVALLDALRGAVPPELSRQLAEAVRELLLAVRALIDWYLDRLGDAARGRARPEVEDIPISTDGEAGPAFRALPSESSRRRRARRR